MKRNSTIGFFMTLVLVLSIGLTTPVFAAANTYNIVSETDTSYVVNNTANVYQSIGYNSNSLKGWNTTDYWTMSNFIWKCKESFGSEYYWHTYVAIPYNTGTLDGTYSYSVRNTDSSENFTISLNQENFANQWVYLGWTKGYGGNNSYADCSVNVNNYNASGTPTREWWIDAMEYYPSESTTPPSYTHGF